MTDYDIGYKKPPVKTRYKKGVSGNPKGTRKPRLRRADELIGDELSKKISISENGRPRKITLQHALYKTVLKKALGGDVRLLTLLFSMMDEIPSHYFEDSAKYFRITQETDELFARMLEAAERYR